MADFLGGLQSRRLPLLTVVALSQFVGWVPLVALVALTAPPLPPAGAIVEAAAGGLAGLVGLGAFYRGLAVGKMSIVAPISATGAAIPVVVGLVGGDRPGALRLAGVLAAVTGVVLASRQSGPGVPAAPGASTAPGLSAAPGTPGPPRRPVGLALGAALGFGLFFVGVGRAAPHGTLWALTCARTPGMLLLLVGALAIRRRGAGGGLPRAALALVALAGLLDVSANGLYALASTLGLLSVVSVLGSLYPVATVLLARLVLAERIRRVQEAGVVLVLGGVALIGAG